MKDAVDREGLNCEFEMRRSYDVYIDNEDAQEAEELYCNAMREGHPWARDFDFVGEEFAEQVCQFPHSSSSKNWYVDRPKGHFHSRCKGCNQHASLQPLALQIRHPTPLQTRRFWRCEPLHPHPNHFHNFLVPLADSPTHRSRQHHGEETNLCHKCIHPSHLSSLQESHHTLQRISLPHRPCTANLATSKPHLQHLLPPPERLSNTSRLPKPTPRLLHRSRRRKTRVRQQQIPLVQQHRRQFSSPPRP